MARFESEQCDYTFDVNMNSPPDNMTTNCPECGEAHLLWNELVPEGDRETPDGFTVDTGPDETEARAE